MNVLWRLCQEMFGRKFCPHCKRGVEGFGGRIVTEDGLVVDDVPLRRVTDIDLRCDRCGNGYVNLGGILYHESYLE